MPIEPSAPSSRNRLAQWWDKLVVSLELANLSNPDTRARLDSAAAKANNQGMQAVAGWDYGAALPLLTAAVEIWSRLEHPFGAVAALNARGALLCKLGDYPAAVGDHETARVLADRAHFDAGAVAARVGLGAVYVEQGDFDLAERTLHDALALSADEPGGTAHAQHILGRCGEARKQWHDALVAYGAALEGWEKLGATAAFIEVLAGMARVALAQAYLPDAHNMIDRVLEHLAAHGPGRLDEPLRVYWSIYQVLHVSRETDAAREMLRVAHEMLERQAAGLSEERRAQFITAVAVNRAIHEAWAALDGEPPG